MIIKTKAMNSKLTSIIMIIAAICLTQTMELLPTASGFPNGQGNRLLAGDGSNNRILRGFGGFHHFPPQRPRRRNGGRLLAAIPITNSRMLRGGRRGHSAGGHSNPISNNHRLLATASEGQHGNARLLRWNPLAIFDIFRRRK